MYYEFIGALGYNFFLIIFSLLALGSAKSSGKGTLLFIAGIAIQAFSFYGGYHSGNLTSMVVAVAIGIVIITTILLVKWQNRFNTQKQESEKENAPTTEKEILPTEQEETILAFCNKCGSPLIKGASFCNKCGSKIIPQKNPKQPQKSGEWKCPSCSRLNPEYTTSCVCGYSSGLLMADNHIMEKTNTEEPYEKMISPVLFCKKCGHKLIEGSKFCNECGGRVIDNTAAQVKNMTSIKEKNKSFSWIARYEYKTNTVSMDTAAVDYEERTTPYITQLQSLYEDKKYNNVIEAGEGLLKQYLIPSETENGFLFCFASCIKFYVYLSEKKDALNKDLVWNAERVSEVLSLMGSSCIELIDFDNAEKYLSMASSTDPTNAVIRCEYANCLIDKERYHEAEKELKEVFRYCVSSDDFARLYRVFGSLYIKTGLYDLAEACYSWSNQFRKSDIASNEILYIENVLKKHDEAQQEAAVKKLLRIDYLKTILDINSVPFIVNDFLCDALQMNRKEDNESMLNKLKELEIVSQNE